MCSKEKSAKKAAAHERSLSLFFPSSFSYVDDAQPARTSVARDHFVHSPGINGWWGKESNLQFDQKACMYDNKFLERGWKQ